MLKLNKIQVSPIALEPAQGGAGYSGFYPLGCLVAYAKTHNKGALLEAFDFRPITPTKNHNELDILQESTNQPIIVLLSCYVWNIKVNMDFAQALKQCRSNSLIIVGGPQIPRNPVPRQEFFDQHPFIDIAVRDEGEITLAELLSEIQKSNLESKDFSRIDLSSVNGLTFRQKDNLITSPDRIRTKDLSIFPSPYTTGEFDPWLTDMPAIMLESNRGCPYGCTFCDWGSATLSKLNRISMDRIHAEIEFAAKHRINQIHFCDANFGILPRDVEIAKYAIKMKKQHGYPQKMSFTNAKTASTHLREVIKILYNAGLTNLAPVSMQTTDHQVLENVERANIKITEYEKLITFLHSEGIPTNSDMMLGLPGQTLETCKKDLQFFFDHKVLAVIFQTSVMPNAPMADETYRKRFEIKVSAEGLVESTYSFTREEYWKMLDLCLAYKLFVKHGLLKYLMYFIQVEYDVKAIDFVDLWVNKSLEKPHHYPISNRIRQELLVCDYSIIGGSDWLMMGWDDKQADFLFDNIEAFHIEILLFFEHEFGLKLEGSAVEAVLEANREVMPKKGRNTPATVPLSHDVSGYFSVLHREANLADLSQNHRPLNTLDSGLLKLFGETSTTSYEFLDRTPGVSSWETPSNIQI